MFRTSANQAGRVRFGRIGAQGAGSGSSGASPVLFTYDFIANPSLPAGLSLSRATVGTNWNSSGTLVTAAINAARFENTFNGTVWSPAGLLVEMQRTNYASIQDPSNVSGWNYLSVAVGSAVPGIDGTFNAHQITPDANFTAHMTYTPGTFVNTASPITLSTFLKPAGYTQFCALFGGTQPVWNLSGAGSFAGATDGVGFATTGHTIASIGNSWYAASATVTPTGAQDFGIGLIPLDGLWTSGSGAPWNAYQWAGDGVKGVIHFGIQEEIGTFPTSYIYTGGGAVTRSADLVSASGTLATQLAAGPSVWEMQDQATGAITRASFAAGAFTFPTSKLYRSFGVYPSGTDTSPYLTVGGAY